MKPFILAAGLCGTAFLGGVLFSPAGAEGNRLLPFWAQPYPYGYARAGAEAAPRPVADPRCTHRLRPDGRRGIRHGWAGRCEVVLHARD